jgi:hypothetical protein
MGEGVMGIKVSEVTRQMDGVEYPVRNCQDIFNLAKENGVAIVYGMSDDLLEFEGVITEELSAWEGVTVLLDKDGLLKNKCEDEKCPYFEDLQISAQYKITAVWSPKEIDASWLIKSNIPHETFDIMEDGKLFCRGIVFSMEDLK